MMNNLGARLGSKAFFPGRNKGGMGNDLTSRVDGAHIFENSVGDLIFWRVGHRIINAECAGKSKGSETCGTIK